MIRLLKESDVPILMGIWLSSNIQAHAFIEPTYWLSHYINVQEAFTHATVYVYEENQRALQFYKREQFVVQQKRLDMSTNEIEYLMVWQTKK